MRILFSHYAIIDKEGFSRSFNLAKELSLQGNEVTFLTGLPSKEFYFPYKKEIRFGVKIFAFPDIVPNFMRRTGFGFLIVISKLIFIIKNNFDIYHSDAGHRPSGGIPILIKKMFVKLTYVCEWWDYFGKGGQYDSKKGIKKITHGMYDLVFEKFEKRFADGIVCLSTKMEERARNEKFPVDRICVINGGADTREIKFHQYPIYRKKIGVDSKALVFAFIGMNLGELKDIIPFIQALNELVVEDTNFAESVLLTTGRYIPKEIASELNIKFKIIELGWVDYHELSDVLNCVDLFVLLQKENLKNETRWPNKIGDYFAAGRKTIINPYGDTQILAKKFDKLFIIVKYDKKSIKDELSKAKLNNEFNNDRKYIREMAENKFSWEQRAIQLYNFYLQVLKKDVEK